MYIAASVYVKREFMKQTTSDFFDAFSSILNCIGEIGVLYIKFPVLADKCCHLTKINHLQDATTATVASMETFY